MRGQWEVRYPKEFGGTRNHNQSKFVSEVPSETPSNLFVTQTPMSSENLIKLSFNNYEAISAFNEAITAFNCLQRSISNPDHEKFAFALLVSS